MSYKLRHFKMDSAHRLYRHMKDCMTLSSAVGLSVLAITSPDNVRSWKLDDCWGTEAQQFPLAFKLNVVAPMVGAVRGLQVGTIDIELRAAEKLAEPRVPIPEASAALDPIIARIGALVFVAFYEQWLPEFIVHFQDDVTYWPEPFAFARRARDFLVHKEGVVAFRSPNAKPVSWHKLTYSPADNGRQILGTDLQLADLLALMFEMDDEMTARGFATA